ncbi:hypothetical protein CY34DRAFT_778283 [Suillus luteus UH-Slu-Lm8-n1]|uniref:Uncharacterized protein n=1 Tax=Suillus luteus UH-Slu-Lm8-n1 TaxID=930992 RepID=A0A0D0AXQ1_9AGAM|nr:hypothetical protein CY34DRAFT_778283 [Suillus luteus UH-Slu-Lm8-n1]
MHSSANCPHSSGLNPTPTRKLNSRNAQAVLVSSMWLQYGTRRLWLFGAHNSRKQNEHMSKPNCTPKPRRHHRTLSLLMLQHPRHIQLQLQEQEQQSHNHHPSHGGLK